MADLSHPWDSYARLQAELSRTRRIGDQAWGAEAALDRILASFQEDQPLAEEEMGRVAASARRRERHRAGLRLVYLPGSGIFPSPEDAIAARQELRAARAKLPARDWGLLCRVAGGGSYAAIVSATKQTSGSLRVRVLRLRRQLTKAIQENSDTGGRRRRARL